jgi:hypothetical protein
MMQCKDCQFCQIQPDGRRSFQCDPFINIIEPECIQKWQLIRLDMLLANYQAMLQMNQKLAPLQDKMIKYMEREMDGLDEGEKWKYDEEDDDNTENDNDDPFKKL